MANPALDDDDRPPDPAALRLQARLRRLMLISGLTLGLGLVAVFGAILYRIATLDATGKGPSPGAAAPNLSLSGLGLPPGARLVSTALDGDRMALTYDVGDGTTTVIVDMRSGAVIGRLAIAAH
jgi:hypothetical protein